MCPTDYSAMKDSDMKADEWPLNCDGDKHVLGLTSKCRIRASHACGQQGALPEDAPDESSSVKAADQLGEQRFKLLAECQVSI